MFTKNQSSFIFPFTSQHMIYLQLSKHEKYHTKARASVNLRQSQNSLYLTIYKDRSEVLIFTISIRNKHICFRGE